MFRDTLSRVTIIGYAIYGKAPDRRSLSIKATHEHRRIQCGHPHHSRFVVNNNNYQPKIKRTNDCARASVRNEPSHVSTSRPTQTCGSLSLILAGAQRLTYEHTSPGTRFCHECIIGMDSTLSRIPPNGYAILQCIVSIYTV